MNPHAKASSQGTANTPVGEPGVPAPDGGGPALHSAEEAAVLLDPSGRILAANRVAVDELGKGLPELIGRSMFEFMPEDVAGKRQRILRTLVEQGQTAHFEDQRQGRVISDRVHPVLGADGQVHSVLLFAQDLTETRQAENDLRKSEALFRAVFDAVPDAISLTRSRDGMFLAVNPGFSKMSGFGWEDLQGKTSLEANIWVYAEERNRVVMELLGKGMASNLEATFQSKDGRRFKGLMSASVLRIEGEPHILAVTRDISARIRAEEALKASEARFRTLIEASPEAVLLARDGWMLMVNRAFLHMTGYAEEAAVLGRSLLDFLAPEERPRVAGFVAARTNGKPAPNHYEALGLRRDGRVFPFEISVAQVDLEDGPATLAYVRDVTRRKAAEDARTELEAQLRQAQKLESVGRLAGGVAHDFNNLLTAIKGNLELVLNDLDRLDPARERLTEIQLAAESAEALTRQLLAFSRQQIIEPRVLSLNDLLVNLEKMLRRLLGADIDLVLTLDPRLRTVKVDAGQVEQIILNLAVNARDAMPRGGTLGLSTENMESTGSRDLEPGQYVRLRVSDNGTGMTDEIKSHLFEPFYTTKGRDKGTGLGLATVYGMVQQNRGTISVHSVCEEGTSFDLLFPVTEEAPREPVVLDTSKVLGGETVLLVEDEPMVRDLARRFLLRLGYQVLDCGSGPEALALVAKHPQVIHLLLTDVIMPGMSGKVLADHLKPLHPETRVLFTSGYTVDEITTHGILEEGLAFLSKPYSLKTLGDKIRLVLA